MTQERRPIPYKVRMNGEDLPCFLEVNSAVAEFPVWMVFFETMHGVRYPVNPKWQRLIPADFEPS